MNKILLTRPAVWGFIAVMALIALVIPQSYAADEDSKIDVIISFKDKPGASEEALVRGLGGEVRYNYNIIDALAASIPSSAAVGLSHNPKVEADELDGLVYAADAELYHNLNV